MQNTNFKLRQFIKMRRSLVQIWFIQTKILHSYIILKLDLSIDIK